MNKDKIVIDIKRCSKLTKHDLMIENIARKFNLSPMTVLRYLKASQNDMKVKK